MIEVAKGLYVGSDTDYKMLPQKHLWGIVHCAKEPYHREALGYKTQGAPKVHPEYLVARRGDRLCLNLVDTDNAEFISGLLVGEAIRFIDTQLTPSHKVLVHCNQGQSRGPGIALAYMAPNLPSTFTAAEAAFKRLYPPYAPRAGIRGWLEANWETLR